MQTAGSFIVVGTALLLMIVAGRRVAHHAFNAEFDANKPISSAAQ